MRLTKKELQEIEVRDRQKAAIHEYGHALVLKHHGFEASPCISRNFTSDPLEEKLWLCQTFFFPKLATPSQLRQIAIAGYLAERMWEEGGAESMDVGDMCWDVEFNLGDTYADSDGWSRADWVGAQGWEVADVAVIHDILSRNWNELTKGAETLAREAKADGSLNP
jgi:hypothetical protein